MSVEIAGTFSMPLRKEPSKAMGNTPLDPKAAVLVVGNDRR